MPVVAESGVGSRQLSLHSQSSLIREQKEMKEGTRRGYVQAEIRREGMKSQLRPQGPGARPGGAKADEADDGEEMRLVETIVNLSVAAREVRRGG